MLDRGKADGNLRQGRNQEELQRVFVDLEKAYDRVPWQEIWRLIREECVPEKYVRTVTDTQETRTQVGSSRRS